MSGAIAFVVTLIFLVIIFFVLKYLAGLFKVPVPEQLWSLIGLLFFLLALVQLLAVIGVGGMHPYIFRVE